MELKGAVAVVTGASAGIGEAAARALARAGAVVVGAARRSDRLDALVRRIEAEGGHATAVRCDVTDPGEVAALPSEVARTHGRCDVLVNNAGIPGGGPFADLTPEQIERLVDTNLLGVFRCTKAFLPTMLEQGRGHIVNIASLAGRFAAPGISVYAATKHGVVAFSEALHYELEPRGILVTAVNPGLVVTEGFPQTGLSSRLVMRPERVARVIVDVVRRGRAPEVSIPRWAGAMQIFRVAVPGPYRWGMRRVARRYRSTPAGPRPL